MEWDINNGSYTYHGLNLDTKPQIKHITRLNKSGYEFDIEIVSVEGDLFKGKVITIGPNPCVDAINVKRGDFVSFKENNIQRLSSNA
jgi:hypothetical protein